MASSVEVWQFRFVSFCWVLLRWVKLWQIGYVRLSFVLLSFVRLSSGKFSLVLAGMIKGKYYERRTF